MKDEDRAAVIAEAYTWLRTPYHHQGRVKGAGVDCATLLAEVYATTGHIEPLDLGNYSMQWHLHRSEELYLGWLEKCGVEIDAPKPGDVVVFKVGRCYSHGGIVVEWPLIIHSYLGHNCELHDASKGELSERPMKFFEVQDGRRK